MLKIITLGVALALLVAGCARPATQILPPPPSDAETTLATAGQELPVPPETACYGVQYIRTDGYHEGTRYPIVQIIRSPRELSSYYEAHKDQYSLERREAPASDYTIGFLDACDAYDEAYFENGYLILVLLEEGSGSIRHAVEQAAPEGDTLAVRIRRQVPEVGTCDMAQWHIILEMNSLLSVEAADVQVWLDDKLAYPREHSHESAGQPQTVTDPVTGYCGNTQTTVYLEDKEYTFWGSDSVMLTDILINLAYDPDRLCDCLPEFRVDTEFGTGYGVNLSESYARCEKGQAALTAEQVAAVRQILSRLQDH